MAIVTAIDGDSRPDPVLTVARDIADAYSEELVVLHVMSDSEFERRREGREYFVDQAADDAEKTARWVVSGTLGDGAGGEDVTVRGSVGEPVEDILSTAEAADARFVVIGGKKRSPAGKAIFGSVTQSVLLNADRPVVTVMDSE